MANIFISYGDIRYHESLARITKQAKASKLFDKVIAYTPKDLPDYIKSSPLFAFHRGGGYWVWKPYIIYATLRKCNVGDVVYYADAGCTINPKSQEWKDLSQIIKNHSAIFFQYRRDFDYGWQRYCTRLENNSVAIKHWMKPMAIDYFKKWFGNDDFLEYEEILSGFCVVKKEEPHTINRVIEDWMKISLLHPSLLIDPWGPELDYLPDTLNVHRHDQSLLTLLAYHYKDKFNVAVVPERLESDRENSAVIGTRWRQAKMPLILYIKYKIYNLLHKN